MKSDGAHYGAAGLEKFFSAATTLLKMYKRYMLCHKLGRVNLLIGRRAQIYRRDHAYAPASSSA